MTDKAHVPFPRSVTDILQMSLSEIEKIPHGSRKAFLDLVESEDEEPDGSGNLFAPILIDCVRRRDHEVLGAFAQSLDLEEVSEFLYWVVDEVGWKKWTPKSE